MVAVPTNHISSENNSFLCSVKTPAPVMNTTVKNN